MRTDLREAYLASLRHATTPGARFDSTLRRRIAEVARHAYLDPSPPPPWVRPYGDAVLDAAWRLARHAGTITEDWYRSLHAEAVEPLDWVEVVGVVTAVIPVVAFHRAIGLEQPDLPAAAPGAPHGRVAASLAEATLNWVPVAAPADQVASVVQALTALPDEFDNLWQLAAAQYMSDAQMADPGWNRGTLSRPQMELVAGRLSLLRECFF